MYYNRQVMPTADPHFFLGRFWVCGVWREHFYVSKYFGYVHVQIVHKFGHDSDTLTVLHCLFIFSFTKSCKIACSKSENGKNNTVNNPCTHAQ